MDNNKSSKNIRKIPGETRNNNGVNEQNEVID